MNTAELALQLPASAFKTEGNGAMGIGAPADKTGKLTSRMTTFGNVTAPNLETGQCQLACAFDKDLGAGIQAEKHGSGAKQNSR